MSKSHRMSRVTSRVSHTAQTRPDQILFQSPIPTPFRQLIGQGEGGC